MFDKEYVMIKGVLKGIGVLVFSFSVALATCSFTLPVFSRPVAGGENGMCVRCEDCVCVFGNMYALGYRYVEVAPCNEAIW